MTFEDLADLGVDILEKIAADLTPEPHVYRWWEPGMSLPAAFMWIGTTSPTEAIDYCTVKDRVRLTLTIMLRPGAHEGEDMLAAETVLDTALPIVDTVLRDLSSARQIKSRANREGFRLATDSPSGDQSEKTLVVEIPIVIPWNRHVEASTP